MTGIHDLSQAEIERIALVVVEFEAEIERLTAENEALRVQVADLEFTIGWRERNNVTTIFGQDEP
jgi:cell division protein FtsB